MMMIRRKVPLPNQRKFRQGTQLSTNALLGVSGAPPKCVCGKVLPSESTQTVCRHFRLRPTFYIRNQTSLINHDDWHHYYTMKGNSLTHYSLTDRRRRRPINTQTISTEQQQQHHVVEKKIAPACLAFSSKPLSIISGFSIKPSF